MDSSVIRPVFRVEGESAESLYTKLARPGSACLYLKYVCGTYQRIAVAGTGTKKALACNVLRVDKVNLLTDLGHAMSKSYIQDDDTKLRPRLITTVPNFLKSFEKMYPNTPIDEELEVHRYEITSAGFEVEIPAEPTKTDELPETEPSEQRKAIPHITVVGMIKIIEESEGAPRTNRYLLELEVLDGKYAQDNKFTAEVSEHDWNTHLSLAYSKLSTIHTTIRKKNT